MNLEESVQKHAEWKVKFRAAIAKQEQMDAGTIAKDNCCQLGQWLYGEGKSTQGTRPEYRQAIEAHRAFHAAAGKVALLINARKYSAAESAIENGTAYAQISAKVGMALIALKKAAKL